MHARLDPIRQHEYELQVKALREKLGESSSAGARAAVLEFILEGLHRGKRLNKTEMDGTAVYGG